MGRFGLSGKKKKNNKNADLQANDFHKNQSMASNIQMSSVASENVVKDNEAIIMDLEKNEKNYSQPVYDTKSNSPTKSMYNTPKSMYDTPKSMYDTPKSKYDPPIVPNVLSRDSTVVADKTEDRYNVDPEFQHTNNASLVTSNVNPPPTAEIASRKTYDVNNANYAKPIRNAMSQESGLGWSADETKSCEDDTYYTLDEENESYASTKGRSTYTYNTHDDDYYYVKQKIAFFSILISTLQLGILTVMMALCGVAPFDVNPMIGPYPDTLSMWGGKNIYDLITGNQYYRIFSPIALHTGVIHLFCNLAIQLETGAFFEREWGSPRWLTVYIVSGLGAMVTNYIFNADTVSVGSSGPIMGLFGAKLSEILSLCLFETMRHERDFGDFVRMEQLGGLLCSCLVVSAFAFIPYVEWSGHLGGFITGFLIGMVIFSRYIKSLPMIFLWGGLGFFGLFFLGAWSIRFLLEETEIANDLADPCTMYSGLHADGYSCQCY